MSKRKESAVENLQRRAEGALERQRLREAETLLEKLLDIAESGSLSAIFAHKHLAELRLERHPWRAALHLREWAAATPDDEVPHAMMGLSQALLGNFRAAVAAYRRALRCAPDTPWYLHNLGHLLDGALDEPEKALAALQRATDLAPDHAEILASYAHCLGRLGRVKEGLAAARRARTLEPHLASHKELIAWLEKGAPIKDESVPVVAQHLPVDDGIEARHAEVAAIFVQRMTENAYSEGVVEWAIQFWQSYVSSEPPEIRSVDLYAAAVEYVANRALLEGRETYKSVADRYAVSPSGLGRVARDMLAFAR